MGKGPVAGIRSGKTGGAAGFEVVDDVGREKGKQIGQTGEFFLVH